MFRASAAIRTVFALCLLVATFNHARAILLHGVLWDYGYGKHIFLASKMYWASLTVLDPLAACLLYLKPRAGIWLTIAIIVSDVVHNTYYVAMSHHWFELFYLSQVVFLVLVVGLAPLAARPFVTNQRVI
ncbi:MAG: hypothetical protein ACRYHA_03945 [Janthinobacterium lividum]